MNVLRDQGISALSILGLIVIWEIAAFLVNDQLTLPSFHQVVSAFMGNWWSIIAEDLPVSSLHFAIGMAGGLLIALPIGMTMGWFKLLDDIFDPIVEILRPIPPGLDSICHHLVWHNQYSAGFIIFIGAVFPILIKHLCWF